MSKYMNAQAHRCHLVMNVIPDIAKLQAEVKPGDGIKMLAGGHPAWAEVVRIDGDTITGTISNASLGSGAAVGDVATVKLWHVVEHLPTKQTG